MKIDKMLIKKRILPTLLISSLLPLVIFLSVPFEIYANNYSEFLFSFSDFFFVGIGFFFLFVAIIFSILLLLPKRAYKVFSALIIACSFLLFFQGTFLNGKMNSLGGDMLEGGDTLPWRLYLMHYFGSQSSPWVLCLPFLKTKRG